ncbi:hypothetical protein VB774_05610 [Pseudanabaena galeata UHCC 0370]|jgi:hypothetical protein|uniref:Outer membrane protein beta-barrel domain-containing protein n=1 Tax=Pseudanabaena galeata UHCC 0370 TaxID=3110310 RepID=A0ABU5TFQ6_9CYAN|nr:MULTISPECIES: hypothetical protein [Pseudanabaena]MEA5477092.1 hypothetical protein [Pseudanabaena galeata UHCC 0370]MEA5486833.1 hypothetical protein [Pseudanabaena sp. CCNP1317]WGS75033.1 hypothetical protein OA858_23875 [Pseudanabaena galeata CCNP1313]
MKLNFLAGLALLVFSNLVTRVEAETINSSNCGWVKDCAIAVKKNEVAKPVTPSTKLEQVENFIQLSEDKIPTVATLTENSQSKATSLKGSAITISQIVPPTDSNGNLIFRSTRSGPSYLGVGANFGVTGGSDLGGTSFAIISKLGLTEVISVRPSVLILRDFATILLPVTYDLAPQQSFGDLQFSPYLGGGIAINTGSNSSVGPMLTAGFDIPLSSSFTINVAANLAFLRTTDLGILVGIGYNF